MKSNRLKTLGLNVKMERMRKDISQEKLAELIGVSRETISMIETANQEASILKIIDIARVLSISLNSLTKDV